MKWIESHLKLARHPKLARLAGELAISRAAAHGHLHFLWYWSVEFAPNGDLSSFSPFELAVAADWTSDANEFVGALISAGWLDEEPLRIHDWDDHAGRSVMARDEAAEGGAFGSHKRWHLKRGLVAPDCRFCTDGEDDHRPSDRGAIGGRSGGESNRTEQDRTEQNKAALSENPNSDLDFDEVCYREALKTTRERIENGADIRNVEAYARSLQKSEDFRHEARKRIGPPPQLDNLLEVKGFDDL